MQSPRVTASESGSGGDAVVDQQLLQFFDSQGGGDHPHLVGVDFFGQFKCQGTFAGGTHVDPAVAGKLFDHVTQTSPAAPDTAIVRSLSERELDVLRLLARGLSNADIRDAMNATAIDLGADVPASRFADEAAEAGAGFVCVSALLTTTMPSMKGTIDALKAAGLREQVKVMVGGAPITREYADEIGADYLHKVQDLLGFQR